jgi:hypothetical protein
MKKGQKKIMLISVLLILFGSLMIWLYLLEIPVYYAANGADINQTLNTTVNITNSAPQVKDVDCPVSLDLEAYGNVTITCNVSVTDYDNNTNIVNATFYYYANNPDDPDNKNNHYTNTSCSSLTPQDVDMDFACSFEIIYFANNGTWYSNSTAFDDQDAVESNTSDAITINPLAAIYIPNNAVLDFGEVAYGDTSGEKLANLTNVGNMQIDISVQGWGVTKGDGLAMNCDTGSIPADYERYNITSGQSWDNEMYNLTTTDFLIPNFNIEKTTDEASPKLNSTYWRLQIPSGAGGICNGKVLFTASYS